MKIKSIQEAKEDRARNKEKRIAKIMVEDYETILKTLDLTLNALSHFKRHVAVMEVLSTIQTNKTLIEIHKKKYERVLGQDEKNKLENP